MSKIENTSKKIKNSFKSFLSDFKKFITKGNILDLAIAVVIGAAFGKIVSSLVSDIITPITGLFLKSGDLAALKWVISPAVAANDLLGIAEVPEVAVRYGLFIQNIVDFIIIGLIVFLLLRLIVGLKSKFERKEIEEAKLAAQAEEEKKQQEAEAIAAETKALEERRAKLYEDIAAQSKILAEIRDIMLDKK